MHLNTTYSRLCKLYTQTNCHLAFLIVYKDTVIIIYTEFIWNTPDTTSTFTDENTYVPTGIWTHCTSREI